VNVEAERRQVTVLFADMVDFTAFSERSGEEAAFTLMRSLSRRLNVISIVWLGAGALSGLRRRDHVAEPTKRRPC
jgi:hypothetical protein